MIFQIMSAFSDILLLGGLDFGTCIDIFRFKDLFEFRGEEARWQASNSMIFVTFLNEITTDLYVFERS